MATLEVPGDHGSIAAAMAAASENDTINLAAGYGPEVVTVTVSNITITGPADAAGIDLTIGANVTGLTLGGTAPFNVTDTNGDDVITGNAGDNQINVNDGNDTVDGGDGSDHLYVDYTAFTGANIVTSTTFSGNGNSISYSNFEDFTVLTGIGSDTITLSVGNNTIDAGEGANIITSGSGANTVITGSGADTITLGDGKNDLNSGDGSDIVSIGTGDNTIDVGEGINIVIVGAAGFGNNILTAGDGADSITVGSGHNYIIAGGGINIVIVGATGFGNNTVIAGDGADSIAIGMGNNFVDGGGGANIIAVGAAGSGNNTILTGDGADNITTGSGTNFICAGGGANIIAAGSGANFVMTGDAADTISVAAGTGNNVIEAGGGANIITTTSGHDIIEAGNAADVIATGDGNDVIKDLGGAGSITAGAGHDRIIMDLSATTGPLTNTLTGAGPSYGGTIGGAAPTGATTFSGVEEFHITGGSGDDSFLGGDGADVLDGGAGDDTLSSGGGSDVIYGGVGDVVDGGEDGAVGQDSDVLILKGFEYYNIVYQDTDGSPVLPDVVTEQGIVEKLDGQGGTKIGEVAFSNIERIEFVDTTVTTLEDTPLEGNLFAPVSTTTVTGFVVGNTSYLAGDTALRTEGNLTINATGSYTFTPAPNYNGPAPVINYTTLDTLRDAPDNVETASLIIEVTPVDDVCYIPPPCFVLGSMIATADGEIPIEDLKVGNLIETLDHGLQPIRWIGHRHLSAGDLAENENMRPIRIRKNVISDGNCVGDLVVSPQHRILIASKVVQRMFGDTEILIAAKQLRAIDGVDIADDFEDVTYFHILFDQHEIIYANGVPTESLYLGEEAQKSLSAAGREEIYTLFPEVASPTFTPVSCRQIIQNKQAKKLALRHEKNKKPLLDCWAHPHTGTSGGVGLPLI
jgi:Ca2+-binding RTX toxin-like protein